MPFDSAEKKQLFRMLSSMKNSLQASCNNTNNLSQRIICIDYGVGCVQAYRITSIGSNGTETVRVELSDGTIIESYVEVECTEECLNFVAGGGGEGGEFFSVFGITEDADNGVLTDIYDNYSEGAPLYPFAASDPSPSIEISALNLQDTGFPYQTLPYTTNPANGETVTIGSVTYTFRDALVGANDVLRHATVVDTSFSRLRNAVNRIGVAGTDYHADTVINPDAYVNLNTSTNTFTIFSKVAGGSVSVSDTLAADSWYAATTQAGTGVKVLSLDYLDENWVRYQAEVPIVSLFFMGNGGVEGNPDYISFDNVPYRINSLFASSVGSGLDAASDPINFTMAWDNNADGELIRQNLTQSRAARFSVPVGKKARIAVNSFTVVTTPVVATIQIRYRTDEGAWNVLGSALIDTSVDANGSIEGISTIDIPERSDIVASVISDTDDSEVQASFTVLLLDA